METNEVLIKSATETDIRHVVSIYNYAVLNTTATFDCEKKKKDDFSWYIQAGERYPLRIALVNNKIVGYGALSKFSDRKGYFPVCEISVYVHKEFNNQGVGTKLLTDLTYVACQLNYHTILAFTTSDNNIMRKMLEKMEYQAQGELSEVAFKFNRRLSLSIYQYFCNKT